MKSSLVYKYFSCVTHSAAVSAQTDRICVFSLANVWVCVCVCVCVFCGISNGTRGRERSSWGTEGGLRESSYCLRNALFYFLIGKCFLRTYKRGMSLCLDDRAAVRDDTLMEEGHRRFSGLKAWIHMSVINETFPAPDTDLH